MAEEIRTAEQADVSEQSRIRLEKLNRLVEEGRNPYEIVRYDRTHLSGEILSNYDALENQTVSIAGRMMSRRVMGKASFAHLLDRDGEIQIYVRRDDVGEDAYRDFKNYDLGDVIGVKGFVFKTKSGEISVHAQEIVLLTKALHPLPEKFHGLTNTDTRYRQRYLDLIVNPEVRDTFVKRSAIHGDHPQAIWTAQGFMEVETPMLVANAGGAAARPFETHFNALDERSEAAHFAGALPQAPDRRRSGEGLRNRPRVPQRGSGHPPQPRVHADGAVSGLYRLPRHDGSDREPLSPRGAERAGQRRPSSTAASRWIWASPSSASPWWTR